MDRLTDHRGNGADIIALWPTTSPTKEHIEADRHQNGGKMNTGDITNITRSLKLAMIAIHASKQSEAWLDGAIEEIQKKQIPRKYNRGWRRNNTAETQAA